MVWLRLNISNLCNFSCKHCHVFKITDNILPKKLMSYETMDYAISTFIDLMNQNNQKNLTLSIYGGETLLNKKNLFKAIEKYGNNYSGVNIYWIVNTNGSLLNEEIAEFFKKHNIDVHISCDGYEKIHNLNRVDKFGSGTFEKVEKALKLIKKHNLKAQINSFIMPENFNKLKDIVDIAKKYSINRIYLDLFYSNVMLDSKEIVERYFEVYSYGLANNVRVHGPWSSVLNRYLEDETKTGAFRHQMKARQEIPKIRTVKTEMSSYFRYLNNEKSHSSIPSINVNVDDSFFFNRYPMTRHLKLNIKNFKDIINSKRYKLFLDSVNSYFNKECKDCYLFNSCFGSAITQYQYHVIKKQGFEESCEFTRDVIEVLSKNQDQK